MAFLGQQMVGQVVEAMDRLVGMGDGRRCLRCGGLASRTAGVLISIVVVQSICTPQIVFNVGDGGGETHDQAIYMYVMYVCV